MKIEVNAPAPPEAKERKYPWIGVGEKTGVIVLFYSSGCGTALNQTNSYCPGVYNTYWADSAFIELAGSITLSND